MTFTIGVIGNGFVGKATQLFKCRNIDTIVYDIRPELCMPIGTTMEDIEKCKLVFICVPTPMNYDGSCYTNIIKNIKLENPYKIIRSTVNIGFSEANDYFFMPEFLTEANWRDDFINSKYWVFGLRQNNNKYNDEFISRVDYLLNNCSVIKSNTVYYLTNTEAEFLKLSKNCYLASKVSIMNELYTLADKFNVDYNKIKKILQLDSRIGNTHLDVPGINNKYGFGGTCFPKDTHSLYNQYLDTNTKSIVFQNVLYRNDFIDRPEREWRFDRWRTTLPTDKPISLVTGGAGFLGTNLCAKLLSMEHIVICLDNFSTGSKKNIEKFTNNPDFLLKNADVREQIFLPHIDYIWHLACPASPPKYQNDPYGTLLTSVIGTKNMITLANQHNAKLLFTSTSEIYGDPLVNPQSETYWGNVNTVGIRSCYDEGKRCAETMIYTQSNPSYKIARLFNTYGPYMDIDDGRVITNFIKNIIHNKPVPIYGDGNQTRCFCYVSDTIDCLIKLMFSDKITGPVNIGNPSCYFTINELVDVFSKILDKKIDIEYLPLPGDDPKQRMPDITLANEQLDWFPKINLNDGLLKLYKYFTHE